MNTTTQDTIYFQEHLKNYTIGEDYDLPCSKHKKVSCLQCLMNSTDHYDPSPMVFDLRVYHFFPNCLIPYFNDVVSDVEIMNSLESVFFSKKKLIKEIVNRNSVAAQHSEALYISKFSVLEETESVPSLITDDDWMETVASKIDILLESGFSSSEDEEDYESDFESESESESESDLDSDSTEYWSDSSSTSLTASCVKRLRDELSSFHAYFAIKHLNVHKVDTSQFSGVLLFFVVILLEMCLYINEFVVTLLMRRGIAPAITVILLIPLVEECFKEFTPFMAVFPLFEFWLLGSTIYRVPALIFHYGTSMVPFQERIVLHMTFNFFAVLTEIIMRLRGRLRASAFTENEPAESLPELSNPSDIKKMFDKALGKMSTMEGLCDLSVISDHLNKLAGEVSDEMIEYGYDLFSFMYRIYRSRNIFDLFMIAVDYVKSVFGTKFLVDKSKQLYKFIREGVISFYNQLLISLTPKIKTESSVRDALMAVRAGLDNVMSSELVTSIRDFILNLVGMKVFGFNHSKQITKYLGPARSADAITMMESTLTTAINVLTAGETLQKGGRFLDIFGASDPIEEFIQESEDLKSLENMTYSGIPVPSKVCERDYSHRVTELIKVGEELKLSLPKNAPKSTRLNRALLSMKVVKNSLVNKMSGTSRHMPYAICFEGGPGIGKGMLVDVGAMIYSEVKGRKFQSTHVFHRRPDTQYWNGYDPQSQPVIHYSEPGALHRSIAMTRGDPTMSEFLSLVDNQPFPCDMADVESKGKVYAMPELVVMDCNDPSMNLDVLVNNPAAIRRRIMYVRPTVKQEFLQEGSCRIDTLKSLNSETPILDRWNFDVYKLEPVDNKKSQVVVKLKGASIYEFCDFMKADMTAHIKQQEARVSITENIDMSEYFDQDVKTTEAVLVVGNVKERNTLRMYPPEDGVLQVGGILEESEEGSLKLYEQVEYPDEPGTYHNIPIYPRKFVKMYENRFNNDDWNNYWGRGSLGSPNLWSGRVATSSFWEAEGYFFLTIYYWIVCGCYYFGAWLHSLFARTWISSVGGSLYIKRLGNLKWFESEKNWQLFRATLGWENSYNCKPIALPKYVPYVALFGALIGALKVYKSSRALHAEGALMTTERWTPAKLDARLAKTQEASGCALPPARKKRGNGIEWDAERPLPPIASDQAQLDTMDEIWNRVRRNIRTCEVTGVANGEEVTIMTTIYGICQDYAVVNTHAFPKSDNREWQFVTYVGSTNRRKCTIKDSEFAVVIGDLCLVRLRGELFGDVRKFLTDSDEEYRTLPTYGSKGRIRGQDVNVKHYPAFTAYDKVHHKVQVFKPLAYPMPDHQVGHCGNPLLLHCGKAIKIAGIHVAGSSLTEAYAEYLNGSLVRAAIDTLNKNSVSLDICSEGALRLPEEHPEIDRIPDPRNPLCYEDVAGLSVIGDIKGFPVQKPGKSKIRSSPFVRCAEELTGAAVFEDGRPVFAPPKFSHSFYEGEYVHPYNHFVKKAGVVKESLDPVLMKKTTDYLTKHIVKELKKRGIEKLEPVSLEVAQNGYPEDFYMRAMKPSTSGGWAYPGPKKKYSEEVELPFKKDAYMPLYDVKAQVQEQIDAYLRGEQANVLLGAQLKDEPRPWAKVEQAKTRVFCMSPYDSTLVNRMYLMPFYSLMVEHGDIFGCCVGINMHSTDVDAFVKELDDFAKKLMEGDYGGFDTSMPYDVGLMSNTIIYNVVQEFGYNAEALKIVKGILSENLNPIVVMGKTLFRAPAFQPSGKYATAEDNSLRGLVMLVYAWFKLGCDSKFGDFFDYVLPKIYGDDVVAGVKEAAEDHFNNIEYEKVCRLDYGLEFTNAQKTKEMAKFVTRDTMSFLKREFVFNDETDHWVARLDRKSIMKAICFYLPSKQVTEADQIISSCVSALRELFFWTPRDQYDELRVKFASKCSEFYDVEQKEVLKLFPRFDDIEGQLYGDKIAVQP